MEMENVAAEAIFDFTPTDGIELTLKVRVRSLWKLAIHFSVLIYGPRAMC